MSQVRKSHAARRKGAESKSAPKGRSKRTRKPGPIARLKQRLSDFKERVLSYKTHAMFASLGLLTLSLYIAWAMGAGAWLRDEVNDTTRSSLVGLGLSIEQIRLEGRNRADLEEVRTAIGVVQGESILHYDLSAARSRLETIKWVEEARVIRFLPKTLHIVLHERRPVALWQQGGKVHLVDAEGFVIEEFNDKTPHDLPLIVGPGAPEHAAELFQALNKVPMLRDNYASAIRIADRRWNLRLQNGVEIRLPAENMDLALSRVVKYDSEHDLLRQEIKFVDLRLPDRVYLGLTDEEAKRLWTVKTRT